MKNPTEWITLGLTASAVLIIPAFTLMIRSVTKWAKMEAKVDAVVENVHQLVVAKDKTHEAMLDQMRLDREATNTRLRWLEENLWSQRGNSNAVRG